MAVKNLVTFCRKQKAPQKDTVFNMKLAKESAQ